MELTRLYSLYSGKRMKKRNYKKVGGMSGNNRKGKKYERDRNEAKKNIGKFKKM